MRTIPAPVLSGKAALWEPRTSSWWVMDYAWAQNCRLRDFGVGHGFSFMATQDSRSCSSCRHSGGGPARRASTCQFRSELDGKSGLQYTQSWTIFCFIYTYRGLPDCTYITHLSADVLSSSQSCEEMEPREEYNYLEYCNTLS
jgi:hypothetical protein